MRLRTLSFHIAAGLALPLLPQAPRFTAKEAVRAEWMRTPPAHSADEVAKLPAADRARYERTIARIGRPGAPLLLPTELGHPTQGAWAQKAEEAKTPRERFDALFFLNRFKDKDALKALDGLKPEDAKTWPKHLHLEAQVATARLNGGEVSPQVQAFLDAMQKEGKVDPVRAQAARLRLVMAGKEKELLPSVKATAGSILALMDSWNRAPWEVRKAVHPSLWNPQWKGVESCPAPYGRSQFWLEGPWDQLGLQRPEFPNQSLDAELAVFQRWVEGLPKEAKDLQGIHPHAFQWVGRNFISPILWQPLLDGMGRTGRLSLQNYPDELGRIAHYSPSVVHGNLLEAYKTLAPTQADNFRSDLLIGPSPIARAAAIEDLPAPPADLDALTKRTWADDQFESQQTLIQSYARWKMGPEEQKAQLRPWLQHPNWSCRFEAYQALLKLDPSTPWPEAPRPSAAEEKILQEAERLAQLAKPVRLRITFSGHRQVTMRLDPTVAPINVANLELLAKKHFFDGHLVPRVVPDFVVQMGSPFDTMDGGPGYTVRCEDSLDWYGPGSVGMALAGKDTGGCQFFITTNATPHLTGKYTRVGEVEDLDKALKILDDLELGAKIESVRVLE